MQLLRNQAPRAWPVLSLSLVVAVLAGLLEWAALSRSRARDAWSAARGAFRHR